MENKVEKRLIENSPCNTGKTVVMYHEKMERYIDCENFSRTRIPNRDKMALYDYIRLDG